LPRGQPKLFFPPNLLTARLEHLAPADQWRTVGADLLVYPSLLPAYGLADIRPNNVMAPAPQLRVLAAAFGFDPTATNYYAAFPRFDHPLLSFLNVRCVVTRQPPQDPRAARLLTIPAPRLRPFTLLLNPRALPRWFVPAGVDLVEPAALDAWIARMSDPARVAVFPAEARGLRLPPRTGPPAAARLLRSGTGHLELDVPGQGERLLATSLPLPAGWSATESDGRRLRPLTIDGAFFGVVVPAGSSRLTLEFAPPGFGAGLAGFAAAVAALLAMAAASRRRLDAPRPLTADS
jgi:Bacterial membrane protein YfhO